MLDTESEKSKFFDDATRLAGEISQNQTFYTVKPLLNFWAAFTPSAEVSVFGPNYFPSPPFLHPHPMISSNRTIIIYVRFTSRAASVSAAFPRSTWITSFKYLRLDSWSN
jgi:hypothetical protein